MKQEEKPKKYFGFCPCSQGIGAILNIAFSFFLIFFSYNAAQNFQSSLRGQLGYTALGVIYVTFAFSSALSPAVLFKLGEKWSMIVGGILYAPFMFANAYPSYYLVLPCAFLCGVGAGVLWAGHGVAVVLCAGGKSRLGFFSGLFFAVYQTNQLAGNLFSAVVLNTVGEKVLFISLGIALVLGVVILLPLQLPELIEPPNEVSEPIPSLTTRLFITFKQLVDKRFLWLIIPIAFSGTNSSYAFGKFPALCGKKLLGYVMSVLGVVDVICSIAIGKLSDKIGKRIVFSIACACLLVSTTLGYVAARLSPNPDDYFSTTSLILVLISAVMSGIVDATFMTQLTATIGLLFNSKSTASAFAAYRVVNSTVTGIWFACGAYIPLIVTIISADVLAIFYVIDIFLLDKFVCPLDSWRIQKAVTPTEMKDEDVIPLVSISADSTSINSSSDSKTSSTDSQSSAILRK